VRAEGAITRKSPFLQGQRQLILLRVPPRPEHCFVNDGDPDYIMTSCEYKTHTCHSTAMSIKAGVVSATR
jgi:hypothetical protein